jgi:hypothetical protein
MSVHAAYLDDGHVPCLCVTLCQWVDSTTDVGALK